MTRGYFDDEEAAGEERQERVPNRGNARGRDTELTLSTSAQLGVILGLLLLCGLCFGLGYAVGHRGSATAPATATQPASPTATPDQEPLQGNGSLPKPSADAQAPLPQGPPESAGTAPPSDGGGANPAATQPEPAANVPTTSPAKSPSSAPATPAQPPTQGRTTSPAAGNAPRSGQQDAPPASAAPSSASRPSAVVPAPVTPTPISPVRPALPEWAEINPRVNLWCRLPRCRIPKMQACWLGRCANAVTRPARSVSRQTGWSGAACAHPGRSASHDVEALPHERAAAGGWVQRDCAAVRARSGFSEAWNE